jgi:chaperonin GroEL (HSP60 family)
MRHKAQHAASISSLILTTECIVTDRPEEAKAAMAAAVGTCAA